MYFLEYLLKMFFLGSLSIQCKSGAIDRVTLGDKPVGHPWSISVLKLHFLLVRIVNILP